MFTGTYTAIVTPFHGDKLDEPALERLIHRQTEQRLRRQTERVQRLCLPAGRTRRGFEIAR